MIYCITQVVSTSFSEAGRCFRSSSPNALLSSSLKKASVRNERPGFPRPLRCELGWVVQVIQDLTQQTFLLDHHCKQTKSTVLSHTSGQEGRTVDVSYGNRTCIDKTPYQRTALPPPQPKECEQAEWYLSRLLTSHKEMYSKTAFVCRFFVLHMIYK